ncbi:hypothetical protein FRC98_17885 [Lujinxingia vulgaris]|uniref:Uncharacterized protein n=1 Tax=Lujinxingia vulgaris TaxID=2600176 RepID=A0A5C6WZI6_9DELT|nr:hypothetical protein [Lujinxingia vulgaris]TXD34989.1 hypothetical protein FRC98_17885 [Lujinxingia vulgaris]
MGIGQFLGEVWRVGLASAANLFLVSVIYCGVVAGLMYVAWGSAPLMALALTVSGLSGVVVWGAMHELAFEDVGRGESSSIWRAFGGCWERYDVVLLASVLWGGAMAVAGAFVLPAALVGGLLLPFMPVVMVEKRSPLGGLMRTLGLVEGMWLRMAVCWLAIFGLLVSVGVVGGAVSAVLGATGGTQSVGFTIVLGIAVAVVVFPLPVVGAVASYRLLFQREMLKDSPEQRDELRAREEAEKQALAVSGDVIDWYEDFLDGVVDEDEDEVARAMRRVRRMMLRSGAGAG